MISNVCVHAGQTLLSALQLHAADRSNTCQQTVQLLTYYLGLHQRRLPPKGDSGYVGSLAVGTQHGKSNLLLFQEAEHH